MLKLLNLQVEGFCSIPELYLQLDIQQIVWIKAANGYGKSTIFSALIWGLYGKTIKGVSDVQTWKEVRPEEYSGTKVSVVFQKDGVLYVVTRCQKYTKLLSDGSKGGDRLVITKDAEELPIKGKVQLQQKLVDILGLSQSLFTNSIMFGQGINRLIQESNSDKKKLFEEVFDLNYLNIARGMAIEDKNNLLSQLNSIEEQSDYLKRELDSLITTYKDLRNREKAFSNTIQNERLELKSDRKKLKAKYQDTLALLEENTSEDVKLLKDKLNKLHKSYDEAKSVGNIPVRDLIVDVYTMLKKKQYNKALESVLHIKESFDNMDAIQEDIRKVNTQLRESENKHSKYLSNKTKLAYIEEDLEDIKNRLNKLKKEKLQVLSPKYKKKIEEFRLKLRKIDEDYHNKELELKDYDWVINDPLGNNGIKAYLFDSSLNFLNNELSSYASILGFNISFEVDLTSNRKDFVTLIERDGHIIDYDELSGGEKQLVDISMALAMNQALTMSKGINISFLDEVFESLSSDNVELVIQLVKEVYKDKTLFLISHHDSLPFSNIKVLEVEKRKGLSYYNGL